jgi:hypothetical protein
MIGWLFFSGAWCPIISAWPSLQERRIASQPVPRPSEYESPFRDHQLFGVIPRQVQPRETVRSDQTSQLLGRSGPNTVGIFTFLTLSDFQSFAK